MKRIKVWLLYCGFALLFAVVFCVMLVLLVAAVIGIPLGVIMSIFGVAMLLFKVNFIITRLAPEILLFGGAAGAFAAAFCGLAAVKAGFAVSRLFVSVRRHCDRLRGW